MENNMTNQRVDILIPSWNNVDQLMGAIASIDRYSKLYPIRFIVINNGVDEIAELPFLQQDNILVLNPKDNLGWEGALKLALEHSDSEFVMFMNDDVFLPEFSKNWITKLLLPFQDPSVGAVGPASNVVMGQQNIFTMRQSQSWKGWYEVPFLIGFCVLMRRSALDAAGGVDDSLPGGDDLDYSIRLRDAGYTLVHDASTFLWHYGFSTGTRIHGGADKSNGWNSKEMSERTNTALIKKHGLRKWHDTLTGRGEMHGEEPKDLEGDLIREYILPGKTIEMGVGGKKTVEDAVGVDMVPKGKMIDTIGQISVADIVADLEGGLPIETATYDTLVARHILEHIQDPIAALKEWSRVLNPGGLMIIAVPDQGLSKTIPMNPEHLHSYTKQSLSSLIEVIGMEVVKVQSSGNGVSLVMVAKKRYE
jgi:hypothetical protein